MPAQQKQKVSGGSRKHGKKRPGCLIYKAENRKKRNKITKLQRYIERNIVMVRKKTRKGHHCFLDKQAQRALKRLMTT